MYDILRAELERVVWHVAKAREIVAHQLDVVHHLGEAGHCDATAAERTLDIFIRTLKSLEEHERLLREEIEQTLVRP